MGSPVWKRGRETDRSKRVIRTHEARSLCEGWTEVLFSSPCLSEMLEKIKEAKSINFFELSRRSSRCKTKHCF